MVSHIEKEEEFITKLWHTTIIASKEREHTHVDVVEPSHSYPFIFHISRLFKAFWRTITLANVNIYICLWQFTTKLRHATIIVSKKWEHTHVDVVEPSHLYPFKFHVSRLFKAFWRTITLANVNIYTCLWQFMTKLRHAAIIASKEREHTHVDVVEPSHLYPFIFHISRLFKAFWRTIMLAHVNMSRCLWQFVTNCHYSENGTGAYSCHYCPTFSFKLVYVYYSRTHSITV